MSLLETPAIAPHAVAAGPKGTARPVAALLLLSPIIAEVLFGVTRITTLFVLPLQVGIWGCGALLIREAVRRSGRGWPAMLLLGLVLAIAEECLIQQTSLAPLVGVDPRNAYGRSLGANWVYLLWALGYESIWTVVLPVQLTELIFPDRHAARWVGRRGVAIATAAFGLASFLAWYSWTQVFVPSFFPQGGYTVPWQAVAVALAAMAGLTAAALIPRWEATAPVDAADHALASPRHAPGLWALRLSAFAFGLAWSGLVFLAYGAWPALPLVVPIGGGIALAIVACTVVAAWSPRPGWNDVSTLALISGATCASMIAGFLILWLSAAGPVDLVGKLVLNLAAVGWLIWFSRKRSAA